MTPAETSPKRSPLATSAIAIAAIVLVFVCPFPFAWMALSSIKKLPELFTVPPHWLPNEPTLGNYWTVLFNSNIPRYFLNSCIISGGATLVALLLAVFASYGFARFDFRGTSPAICGEELHLALRGDDDAIVLGAFASDGRQVMAASAAR